MLKKITPTSLKDKAVIIPGGTTGIGRATVLLLASEGAQVLIFGRHEQELNDALADMPEGSAVFGLTADTTKPDDIARVFAEAAAKMGGVGVLINNAAEAAQSILDTEYAEWQYVVQVNVLGYMACARHAIDRMKVKGTGRIVNIGSLSAKASGCSRTID